MNLKNLEKMTIVLAIIAVVVQLALWGFGIWIIIKLLQHFGVI